jgi:hypothetical protein
VVKTEQNNKEATLRIEQRRKIFRKIPELYKERLENYSSKVNLGNTISKLFTSRL